MGRVRRLEADGGAVSDFPGFLVTPVAVPKQPLASPYTRWGDWLLGLPGLFLTLAVTLHGLVRPGVPALPQEPKREPL